MDKKRLRHALVAIVGDDFVLDDPASMWVYGKDASPLPPATPDLAVVPETTEQVAAILALANETRTPVYPRSSGSNLWGGCIPCGGGIVVDLRRMNRVISIDEELFSCTVQPAVTFVQLNEALAKHKEGYYNLVSPEGALTACVAGSFLAHGDGIGSALWGTQGDAIVGCKVVIPSGEVIITGSAANPSAQKVAGGSGQFFRYAYANDLTGLFCGSEGTLGILVEATTRIERIPARYGFAALDFASVDDACQVLYRARQERIQANFAALREKKSMEALRPGEYPDAQLVYIIEGDDVIVEHQLERLRQLAREHGGVESDNGKARAYWEKRYSLIPGGMYKLGARALLPLHYPLGKMAWYYHQIRDICDTIIAGKYRLAYFIGGFQIGTAFVCYPTIMFLEQYPKQYQTVMACAREAQESLLGLGGAPIQMGTLWGWCMPRLGTHFELLKRIKQAIDPNNIMSPGTVGFPIDE